MLNNKRKLKNIRNRWSKGRLEPENEFEVSSLFRNHCHNKFFSSEYMIDDQTWSDLDMSSVFIKLNHTTSRIGSQVLYTLLRFPKMKTGELKKRERIIKLFKRNSELRESIQLEMLELDNPDSHQLTELIWGELPKTPNYLPIIYILNFIAILSIPIVMFKLLPWYLFIIIYVVNISFYYHLLYKISSWLTATSYLTSLEKAAVSICNNSVRDLEENRKFIIDNLSPLKSLSNKLWFTSVDDGIGILDYIKIYFLIDVIYFYKGIDELKKHRDSIQTIFLIVGTIDALIAIASYRNSIDNWVQPDFEGDNVSSFTFSELAHPLLAKPTANSASFDSRYLIVTGSNMTGKSTFIKTLGVNAILAQSIHTCLAKAWSLPMVIVRSCMIITDDLERGKSYYLVEAERIHSFVEESDKSNKHLFLIDEMFKGTNYRERLAATTAVLNYLSNNKDLVVIATHDTELCKSVNDNFRFIHFSGEIQEGNFKFDYKIKSGISNSTNAIDILKLTGFPDCIITNAKNRL